MSPVNITAQTQASQVRPQPPEAAPAPAQDDDARLRAAAQQLEASFLAEMLKSAGVGESIEGWSGGPGEDQFASFLRQAQADEMTQAGGIGLAESIFEALKERADA